MEIWSLDKPKEWNLNFSFFGCSRQIPSKILCFNVVVGEVYICTCSNAPL
jgi:hypothetical protein